MPNTKGLLGGFAVLRAPGPGLEELGREERVGAGFVVVGCWALITLTLNVLQAPERLDAGLRLLAALAAVTGPVIWWVGLSSLLHLTVRLFGGRSSYAALLAVVGAACAPLALGSGVLAALELLELGVGELPAVVATAISAGALLWHAGLAAGGSGLAAGIGYRGGAASCALSGLGCATALALLGITLAVLLVTLGTGAAGL